MPITAAGSRKQAHKLAKNYCERCGQKKQLGLNYPFIVHHRDGNPFNNSPDNLETLCSESCHAARHRDMPSHKRKFKERFLNRIVLASRRYRLEK